MMDMGLRETFESHFRVQSIQDSFGFLDSWITSIVVIQSRLTDEIQQFGEYLVIAHHASNGSSTHCNECSCGESVLRRTFLIRGLIIVRAIEKERINGLSVKRINVCFLIPNHAMTNEGTCIQRADRLATMTMNQSEIS
jgi:hypothetical protein